MRRLLCCAGVALAAALLVACAAPRWSTAPRWSIAERAAIASLALDALPPLPPDPSNHVADDPAAAALGKALFADVALSAGGTVACTSCHIPALGFTDGRTLAQGEGAFHRHTPTLLGAAWSPWLTWDGKADSLWSQALLPLENPAEQGIDRTEVAHAIARSYAEPYTALFGPLPPLEESGRFPAHAGPVGSATTQAAWQAMTEADRDAINRVFSNVGKALAAFQRTLTPPSTRFDLWAAALAAGAAPAADAQLSPDEQAGLRLFIGKAQCLNCHNGPLFTNNSFHNTGVAPAPDLPLDAGRAAVVAGLADAPFGCLGAYSDADAEDPATCGALRYLLSSPAGLEGAFRTPTLRNVAATAPYMHAGQIGSLAEVLRHYNAGGAPVLLGHNELAPLELDAAELAQLEAFLQTLTTPAVHPTQGQ